MRLCYTNPRGHLLSVYRIFNFSVKNLIFFLKTLSIIFFVIGPTPFIAAWWFLLYIFSILIPRDTFCSFLAIWFFPWDKLNFTLNYLIPICGHPNHRSLVYFLCNFVIPISRNTACPFFIIYFFHEIIFFPITFLWNQISLLWSLTWNFFLQNQFSIRFELVKLLMR